MHCGYLPGLAFRKRLLHGLPSGVVLGRGRQPCWPSGPGREAHYGEGGERCVCVGGVHVRVCVRGCACVCGYGLVWRVQGLP